jgi:hypothetical protein
MDYAIHPKTGKKQEIHSRYPKTRQDGQDHDCLFCINADTCIKHNGIFFVGEKYKPCKKYMGRRERSLEIAKELDEEKAKRNAIKKIFTPTPRSLESKKDCLNCKKLIEPQHCRNRYILFPKQGDGVVCPDYLEVNVRPEGVPQHCIYCLINFKCEHGRVVRDGQPCDKYVEYTKGDNYGN